MLRRVSWVARGRWDRAECLLILLTPPHGAGAVAVTIAGYVVLGLGLLAWGFLDAHPDLSRAHTWALPLALGAITTATGFASTVGRGASVMVAFALVAAMIAGSETSLVASLSVTAAGVLAIEVGGLIFGGSYGTFIGSPVLVVVGLVFGRNRGAYRVQDEQAARLLAQQDRLQAEQRRADLLDERARIAREIHDVLAHSLGALGIQIQAARSMLHKDTDRAAELLAAAQQMAAEGLTETRRAVHALRTDTLPLGEELARASDAFAQRYGVAVSFDTAGVPAALPPDATLALLRIAQEALVNAAKHAAGQGVTVRLDYGDADVRLTVRNDLAPGAGAEDPATVSTVNGGYGLTGMRERLRLLNGTLEAGSRDGQWI